MIQLKKTNGSAANLNSYIPVVQQTAATNPPLSPFAKGGWKGDFLARFGSSQALHISFMFG